MLFDRYNDIEMFPTHVGMNRAWSTCDSAVLYVPHTRGDEPIHSMTILKM